MPFHYVTWYSRQDIRNNPEWLYVFGDNLAGYGYGGQAKEARGEANAIGIPTKRAPHWGQSAYLSDDDLEQWVRITKPLFNRIELALSRDQTVVWPMHGIGTGLAKLSQKAPLISKYITDWLANVAIDASDPPLPTTRGRLSPEPRPIPVE